MAFNLNKDNRRNNLKNVTDLMNCCFKLPNNLHFLVNFQLQEGYFYSFKFAIFPSKTLQESLMSGMLNA